MTSASPSDATRPGRIEADARPQPSRLPISTRPRPGDTVAGYIARLAAANHLALSYLRGYLRPTGGYSNAVDLERLAALSGHDPGVLTKVFTSPRCLHCASVLPTDAKKTSGSWCSARCRQAATALRQNPRSWNIDTGNTGSGDQAACPRCGQPIERSRTGRAPRWCSATCRKAAYDDRYRNERTRRRHRDWHLVSTRTQPAP